jgi:hypothetical protein
MTLTLSDFVSLTVLVGIFQFLSSMWLEARLKASIEHEYDRKLEDYRFEMRRREQAARVAKLLAMSFRPGVGEDVLRTWPGGSIPSNLFSAIFNQIKAFLQKQTGYYVWAWQELMMGQMDSTLNNNMLSSDHGGWQFNPDYGTDTVSQADDLPTSELQTNAFFNFTNSVNFTVDLALEGPSGSAYAGANRNRILSDAIPAVTLPLGANPVPDSGIDAGDFNMQALFENGWPVTTGSEAFNWHHTDFRAVAYTFTYKAFDQIVIDANLNQ